MRRSLFLILLGLLSLSACKRSDIVVEERYVFPDKNWGFEERIVLYSIDIEAMANPCKVMVELEHSYKDVTTLPLILTIKSPDGGSSTRKVNMAFGDAHQQDPNRAVAIIYPQKYFNTSGTYEFSLLREWPKYEFYGNEAITLKIIKLPIE